jgi:hypothetical protein
MKKLNTRASALAMAILPFTPIQANELNPDISVVLDGFYKQNHTALSSRGEGFGLGHTELSLSSPIDDLFEGRLPIGPCLEPIISTMVCA